MSSGIVPRASGSLVAIKIEQSGDFMTKQIEINGRKWYLTA